MGNETLQKNSTTKSTDVQEKSALLKVVAKLKMVFKYYRDDMGVYHPSMTDRLRWKLQALPYWFRCNVTHMLIRKLGGVPAERGNSIVSHAVDEFNILWPKWREDAYQKSICEGILDILAVFSAQGHSGCSASYAQGLIEPLLSLRTLSPLIGDDSEWIKHDNGSEGIYQNKRFSSVFKNGKDGQPYWAGGRVFREPDGVCFTDGNSSVDITFPFTVPEHPEYVDVEAQPEDEP